MQIHDQLTLDKFQNPDQVFNTFRNDLKPKDRVITILTLFQRRDDLHHMLSEMGISSTGI
ncbi:unnamed protein product [Clonostachys chloroleuca]|uniref:Uncharacterized protein n=1 Tax=Clonostachys chloroleuca TaxID=1926264 RepID=A0AA35M668_9HYPO|nr:unnamed protein product [Clonostachys chloroleuca]